MAIPAGARPAGGCPVSAGGGAAAVAAVNTWREFHSITRQTPASATGAYASYLVLTTGSLAGGVYSFTVTMLAGGPLVNAGSEIEVQLVINPGALVLSGPLTDYGVANGRYSFSGSFTLPLPPGVATLDLQFRQPVSPGTTQALGANWAFERVA